MSDTDTASPADDGGSPLQVLVNPLGGAGPTIAEVRRLVEEHLLVEIGTVTDPVAGADALVVIDGTAVRALDPKVFDGYADRPRFRQGTAQFTAIDSLINHANRFKDDGSAVFANDSRSQPSLTVVVDYNEAGSDADTLPRFGRHRGTFAFPLSDEWKVWNEKNGPKNAMTMADFAAFLEDRITDVLYLIPGEDELSEDLQKFVDTLGGNIATPHQLVELSRGLQINENSVIREVNKLSSGEGQLLFQTEHTDENGAPLKIPNLFLIGIPVFKRGPFYRIAARLRYRKATGGVIFWYELWRPDRSFDNAFEESLERVAAETGLPVFRGSPEA